MKISFQKEIYDSLKGIQIVLENKSYCLSKEDAYTLKEEINKVQRMIESIEFELVDQISAEVTERLKIIKDYFLELVENIESTMLETRDLKLKRKLRFVYNMSIKILNIIQDFVFKKTWLNF